MKMEVLSVQNHHIQKRFGVIGSTKAKRDWTSSLTPPTLRITPSPRNQEATTTAASTNTALYDSLSSPIEHFDVVDLLNQELNSVCITRTTSREHRSQRQHSYGMNMETTPSAPKGGIDTSSSALYTYNNNLLYCSPSTTKVDTTTITEASSNMSYHTTLSSVTIAALTPSPASSNLSTPTEVTEQFGITVDDDVDAAAINELAQRLQAELRAAKSRHLSCTEVSLPWDLTPLIAADMIKTSEREPCGVRGCAIFIDFEDETGNVRRIASFKIDPNTVSTFELYLTLKQDKGGWTSLLPQFLKNLTRSSTILISPHFTLNKHKLYACE